jgi:hypothetical protein
MRSTACQRIAAVSATLAFAVAGDGLAMAKAPAAHGASPVAPAAVAVVRHWLDALAAGDRAAACRLFPALPACSGRGLLVVRHFTIHRAERTVDGVNVPVTIDDEYALVWLQLVRGRYRIVDVIA